MAKAKRRSSKRKKYGKMPRNRVGRAWVKSHCGKRAIKKFGKKKGAPRVGLSWIGRNCKSGRKAAKAYLKQKSKRKRRKCVKWGGCGCEACKQFGGCRCITTTDGSCAWPMTMF